jgi:hypothetical protein
MKKLAFFVFFACFPLVATGCGGMDVVDPAFDIPDSKTVAVVPFRDEDFDVGFESPRGCELAAGVARRLADKGDLQVIPKEKVLALYDSNARHPPGAPEIAKRTSADYVLMADVVHWQTRDSNTSGGLLRGQAVIDVSVYETYDAARARAKSDKEQAELPPPGKGRLVLAQRRVSAVFPRDFGMAGFGTTEMTEAEVEDGLKLAAAQAVSWLLVSHTKDEEKHAEGK